MGIFLFPSPSPSAQLMVDQRSKLLSLRQGGASVKEFAYLFVFTAEGLNISDAALKDILNSSLNEPISAWEMGMLGILSFWQFVGFVYNRGEEGGLPPLGPPPIPLTSCQVPSPLMTPSGRGRRKNRSASSATCPEVAEPTVALPVMAVTAAVSPEATKDAAAPPEATKEASVPTEVGTVPPPRPHKRRKKRKKSSSIPVGPEAFPEPAVGPEAFPEPAVGQEATPEPAVGPEATPEAIPVLLLHY